MCVGVRWERAANNYEVYVPEFFIFAVCVTHEQHPLHQAPLGAPAGFTTRVPGSRGAPARPLSLEGFGGLRKAPIQNDSTAD